MRDGGVREAGVRVQCGLCSAGCKKNAAPASSGSQEVRRQSQMHEKLYVDKGE